MARIYTTPFGRPEDLVGIGSRLYRIFLLSIVFWVLWVKEFLWTAFIIALLLYLLETIILPALAMQVMEMREAEGETEPEPRPPPRRGGGRGRWKWPSEE